MRIWLDPQRMSSLDITVTEVAAALRDVGRIKLGSRSYASIAKLNNRDTAFVVIYQLPDANALDVAENVKQLINDAAPGFPDGVEYSVLFDSTEFISRSIDEVIVTLLQAVGLVLAIGIVVDDVIVVIENVERLLQEEKLPIREAVTKAMAEVTGPVIATTLVLLAVFVPVGFMPGITGELYKQFSVTISVAVIISSINALTLSPALCVLLLGRGGSQAIPWLSPFEKLIASGTRGYDSLVTRLLRKGVLMGLALGAILLASAGFFKAVPAAFVPPDDPGFLFVDVQLPDAAALERTDAVLEKVTDVVLEDPAVTDFITVSG